MLETIGRFGRDEFDSAMVTAGGLLRLAGDELAEGVGVSKARVVEVAIESALR